MFSERLARWQFWLLFIGFILTFGPMHIAGMLGMPRRIYTYEADRGWDLLEPADHRRSIDSGAELPDLRLEPGHVAEERAPGRRRSLGRLDAGMGDDVAAAVVQLRDDPDGAAAAGRSGT